MLLRYKARRCLPTSMGSFAYSPFFHTTELVGPDHALLGCHDHDPLRQQGPGAAPQGGTQAGRGVKNGAKERGMTSYSSFNEGGMGGQVLILSN